MFSSIVARNQRIARARRIRLTVEDLEGRVVPSTMMPELGQAATSSLATRIPRLGEEIPTATGGRGGIGGIGGDFALGAGNEGFTYAIDAVFGGKGGVNGGDVRLTIGEEIPS